jgi:hypothetical protein
MRRACALVSTLRIFGIAAGALPAALRSIAPLPRIAIHTW